jgi:hypothetical protein
MMPLRRLLARLGGTAAVPPEFAGTLTADEQVLAVARAEQGPLVATHLGLWLADPPRRIGWHLVSKATWGNGVLGVVEAEECGQVGDAVLLRDGPLLRYRLTSPGRLPDIVHDRVTGSIKSSHYRELPGGGARFVQRKVPGQDGIILQVRADEGTEEAPLQAFVQEVSDRIRRIRQPRDK